MGKSRPQQVSAVQAQFCSFFFDIKGWENVDKLARAEFHIDVFKWCSIAISYPDTAGK